MMHRILLCLGLLLISMSLRAQYPDRPIRLIVPFAAGGNTDIIARLLGQGLGERLGQRFVIENRTGAGAVVGTDVVAKARNDGYTLLFTSITHTMNPPLRSNLPFDPVNDFTPIVLVAKTPLVLLVGPQIEAKDFGSFLRMLKAAPGRYAFGSAGNGSATHMSVELLRAQAGVDVIHVPYQGEAPALRDLVGGRIAMVINGVGTSLPQIKARTALALAVTTSERSALIPDVPTFKEMGLPDYEFFTWNVVLGPRGVPPNIVVLINQASNEVMASPQIATRMRDLAIEPITNSTPVSTAEFMAEEMKKWKIVVERAGLKPE